MYSPRRATEKKVLVRQAKTAASRGMDKSNLVAREAIVSRVMGARLGLLEVGGASIDAPSRAAFISAAFMRHGAPCRVCQARIA